MRRRRFLKGAGLGVAASALASPAVSQERPAVEWRMASAFSPTFAVLRDGSVAIARRVAALTEGAFRIELVEADHGGVGSALLGALRDGEVDCAHADTAALSSVDPAFAFDAGLPFGFNARQQAAWMLHGPAQEPMRGLYGRHDLVRLPAGNAGARMGGWFRTEANTLGGLRRRRMAVSGLAGNLLARLGATMLAPAGDEIAEAFASGQIDAVEGLTPADDERHGYGEFARYYYYPGWWRGSVQFSLLVARESWSGLTDGFRSALEAACAEAGIGIAARYDAANPMALRRLIASGTELRPFGRDTMLGAYRASEQVLTELAADNPAFAEILGLWRRFRVEQFAWFRIAENTYDNFAFVAHSLALASGRK